ncbi:TetR family transcriptional regulator [Nocardia sp. NBC_01503]|uniref:TetR/AcrR family transcriptional regulator n=1 Tax=Nocardia sp. NBC_01503 TaxID=2975997 RepID=UPI002E7C3FF1|nr:TetR family transcriptional regulator [Nocardia sp. NBC_01503]WTL32140.1 TetR family transcriptional regulator [Nocardia sp. NBC_01503]
MSKEDRKDARRTAFLDAGIAVIAESGIADTKVRDVCRRAELTERYFYESFDNLDTFAKAVIEAVAMQVAGRLFVKAVGIDEAQARLRAVAKELVTILDEDPRVGRILFIEPERAGGALAKLRQQMLYGTTWLMTMWLENPESNDMAVATLPMVTQFMNGGSDAVGPLMGDITTIAMAGAAAEVLMAWVDDRLDMSAEELVDYLLSFLDEAVAWRRKITAADRS